MKFGLMFANIGPFMLPESLARLAGTAEHAGIDRRGAKRGDELRDLCAGRRA